MANHDVKNAVTPLNTNKAPSKPTISAMRTAIAASGVAASYPTATLEGSTRRDLIYICRQHGITVDGL